MDTVWTGGLWTKVTLIHGGYGYPVDGYPPPTPAPTPTLTPTPAVATGDAGFEQVQVGYGRFQYRPSGSPWTFTGGAGISGNGSGFTWSNPPAPQGVQVAFIQSTGAMSQTVEGWAAGTYALTFDAAQRGNSGTSMEDFQVLIDGVPVGTFNPSGTSYHSYSTVAFTVTAGAHTIVFQGLDTAGGDNTAFVDAVAVMQATPSLVADPGFDQVVVGYSQLPVSPDRLTLDLHRRRRHLGQQQRLHRGQPAGAAVRAGRLPAGDRRVQPGGYRLGRRLLHAELLGRAEGRPGVAPGLPGPGRRGGGGHVHAHGHVVPILYHRRVHGHRRVAHDRLPGAEQRRRRQYRLRRPGRGADQQPFDRRRRVRAGVGGRRPVPVPAARLRLDLHRRRRHLGQQQRLHLEQPAGAAVRAGRLPAGDRLVQPDDRRLGRRLLHAELLRRPEGRPGGPPGLRRARRRRRGGHLHALGHVVPILYHRRVHRRRRVAHDRLPGPEQRRRRQYRLRRRHHADQPGHDAHAHQDPDGDVPEAGRDDAGQLGGDLRRPGRRHPVRARTGCRATRPSVPWTSRAGGSGTARPPTPAPW